VLPGCKSVLLSHLVEKVARLQIFDAQTAASLRQQKLVLCLSQVVGNTCPQYPLSRDCATATDLHGRPADCLARQPQSESEPEGSQDLWPPSHRPYSSKTCSGFPPIPGGLPKSLYHRIICTVSSNHM
jgi:hypothetical protein